MKWKNAAVICFASLCFAACHVSDPSDEIVQIGVDEELIVDMVQTLHNGNVDLGLSFVSSTPYDCGGAGYDYNLFTTQSQVNIYLTSVLLPQPCSPGPTPAREEIKIPSQPGTYSISIGIGDLIQNMGTLVIDDQRFHLNMEQQHGITLSHETMYRIPQNTIWGYMYHPDKQAEVNDQVLTTLSYIAVTPSFTPGYYGLFNLISPSTIQVLEPGIKPGTESFIFRYHGEPTALANTLAQLRTSLPSGTLLKVFGWDGAIY